MDDYYRVWGQGRGGIERVFPEIPLGALGAGVMYVYKAVLRSRHIMTVSQVGPATFPDQP